MTPSNALGPEAAVAFTRSGFPDVGFYEDEILKRFAALNGEPLIYTEIGWRGGCTRRYDLEKPRLPQVSGLFYVYRFTLRDASITRRSRALQTSRLSVEDAEAGHN
jgi:hypothetical protein